MEYDKQLGPEAELKFAAANGALRMEVAYTGKDVSAGMYVQTSPDQVVNALEALLPKNAVIDGAMEAVRMGLKAAVAVAG